MLKVCCFLPLRRLGQLQGTSLSLPSVPQTQKEMAERRMWGLCSKLGDLRHQSSHLWLRLSRVRSDPKDILQADPALWTFCGLCVWVLPTICMFGVLWRSKVPLGSSLCSPGWSHSGPRALLASGHCSRLAHVKSHPGRALNSSAHSQTEIPLSLEGFPPCDQAQELRAAVCCFPAPTLTSALASLLMSHAQCLRLPWFTLSGTQQGFGSLSLQVGGGPQGYFGLHSCC